MGLPVATRSFWNATTAGLASASKPTRYSFTPWSTSFAADAFASMLASTKRIGSLPHRSQGTPAELSRTTRITHGQLEIDNYNSYRQLAAWQCCRLGPLERFWKRIVLPMS